MHAEYQLYHLEKDPTNCNATSCPYICIYFYDIGERPQEKWEKILMWSYYVLLMYDVAKAIKACTLYLILQISLNFRYSTIFYVLVSFNSPLTLITKPYSIL